MSAHAIARDPVDGDAEEQLPRYYYLLWQAAYSELVFRDELWPDFSREAFASCIGTFSRRRRRFGGR